MDLSSLLTGSGEIDGRLLKQVEQLASDDSKGSIGMISTLVGLGWDFGIRDKLSDAVKEHGIKHATALVKTLGAGQERADKLGRGIAATLSFSVYLGKPLKSLSDVGKNTFQAYKGIGSYIAPLQPSGSGFFSSYKQATHSSNEMLRTQSKRERERMTNSLKGVAYSLVSLAVYDKQRGDAKSDVKTREDKLKALEGENTSKFDSSQLRRHDNAIKRAEDIKSDAISTLEKLEQKETWSAGPLSIRDEKLRVTSEPVAALAKVAGTFFDKAMKTKNQKLDSHPTAYEMTVGFSKHMEKERGANMREVRVKIPGHKHDMKTEDAVMAVFERHQQDIEGLPLGERFAGMDELKVATKIIGDAIAKGADPKILVELVGNRRILGKDMSVAEPDQVYEQVDAISRQVRAKTRIDNVGAYIAKTSYGDAKAFKEILNGLQGEDKAVFASLWPDAVLAKAGGLKPKEISQLREQSAQLIHGYMAEMVEELSELTEKQWKENGIVPREAKEIKPLAAKLAKAETPEEKSQLMLENSTLAIEATLAQAKGYWASRIGGNKPKKTHEDIIAAREEKKEAKAEEEKADLKKGSVEELEKNTDKKLTAKDKEGLEELYNSDTPETRKKITTAHKDQEDHDQDRESKDHERTHAARHANRNHHTSREGASL